MRFVADLSRDERLGGKARSLAELATAGLPTPAGFVVTDALFRSLCPAPPRLERLDEAALTILDGLRDQLWREPWPDGFRAELDARLATLRATRLSVRSSFAAEDRPEQVAAGIFESRVGIPVAGLERALRDVLRSAFAPGAVAYALAHGEAPATGPVAVLVHEFVAGAAEGSAAFAPGVDGYEPRIMVRRGQLPDGLRAELAGTVGNLAALRGPVEIEWVLAEGRLVYLQSRPFTPPKPAPGWAGWRDLPAAEPPAEWHWDQAHNPLPLSPAQAGLVELADERCRIGIRQRVLGGYLFYRTDDRPLPPQIPEATAERYFAQLRAKVEEGLAAVGNPPALEDALAVFLSAYEPIFGVLQPALRRTQAGLRDFLEQAAPDALSLLPALRRGVSSVASERLALAQQIAGARSACDRERALVAYLERFGDEAPGWDVSLPTYAEEPSTLAAPRLETLAAGTDSDWQHAQQTVEAMLGPGRAPAWRQLLEASRGAVALGEADDWLYARAQTAVRRALLSVARPLVGGRHLPQTGDVFYLPLALARALATGLPPPADLGETAEAGRRAWAAARRAPPPLLHTPAGKVVRGIGVGGRAVGRVVVHRPGVRSVAAADTVLVAATLLPTELPLLTPTALVVETGGPLDHVAAQARERGLPAVVGAVGALAAFAEGELVLVDGDRGLVVAIG